MKTRDLIREFFGVKRFAFVGVSRHSNDFSRKLFGDLVKKGYDPVPVNPHATEIDGRTCYERVQDLRPPVTAALLLVPRFLVDRTLLDCYEGGVTLAWIYGITGPKELNETTLKLCEEHGIGLIPGYCPYMFLEKVPFFHGLHGLVWKAIGLYPRS